MGADFYYVIRTYTAGTVVEKIKYRVEGKRPTKSVRRLRSDINKIKQNETSAKRRVARILNANCKKGDCLVGLDYSDAGMGALIKRIERDGLALDALEEHEAALVVRKAAERELDNFLRRCREQCARENVELKYVAVTSDMDGDTGETVRIHHHVVVNAQAFCVLLSQWKLGGVELELMSGQADYTALAEYLINQVRYVPDEKKYKSSRNLIRPQPQDRIAINGAELRVPKMGFLLHRSEWQPGRPQYIRYIQPPVGYSDSAEARTGARQYTQFDSGGDCVGV